MPSLNIANLQNLLKRAGSPWSARANKITALDSGGIASVSRISNSMEVWWVGANGSIGDNFWYP